MKNAELILALNKAREKSKTLTAQITDLFSAGEETLVGEETLTVSPPSSPIPNSVEKRNKKEGNGTPEKPRKRTLSNEQQAIAKRRRSSQRLARLLSTS